MSECNYCIVERIKRNAAQRGNIIMLHGSKFMGGINALELSPGEEIPPYVECSDALPNGDDWYRAHAKGWFMAIGSRCGC